jgi:hypothetical protein
MSYTIYLMGESKIITVQAHTEGAIISKFGNSQAEISVTNNYTPWYCLAFRLAGQVKRYENPTRDNKYPVLSWDEKEASEQGLHYLKGKKAGDMLELLRYALVLLGSEQHKDYWLGTSGNAGHVLKVLLGWAIDHPDAIFEVTHG